MGDIVDLPRLVASIIATNGVQHKARTPSLLPSQISLHQRYRPRGAHADITRTKNGVRYDAEPF